MTPLERLSRITTSLGRASELTLQRIETELGLTPRPESPDAGEPYERTCVCGDAAPCKMRPCYFPIYPKGAPMTPVSERGMHE